MGEIFLAEQSGEAGFRKQLVIKRLFTHLATHPEAVRMFQDEAHVLSCLSHPNIPQVYDLGFTDGQWFIAIEHVPGHTLAELCSAGARAGAPMPIDATISAVEQLCDALHHAHERCDVEGRPMRVVHRDVTPQNVMVTPDGYGKLLDFGVARTARDDAGGGGVKGTLAYMSPEQVRGQRLDKRSDVFSVGVVLYELTTGHRLFHGSEVEVMTTIVERDVTPPSALIPGYPAELERIVLMALARDRARRWPSASHLARAIEDYCVSIGIVATHQSLARYYQQVFSAEEKVARASGSYRPVAPSIPPEPTTETQRISARPPRASSALDDLRALRSAPPSADRMLRETPRAIRLPSHEEALAEDTPLVLTRPKRGA
jgi:serine/threonine-protein kinase